MKARNRWKLQTILAAVIIIVALVYALFIRPNYYKINGGKIYFEPVFSESIESTDITDIYTYNGYLYRISENGFKKMTIYGDSIWDKTFYILNPKLYTNNQYMAVIDVTGKEAYLFNEEGSLVDIHTEYPILFGAVSSEGALVLVEEMEGKHLIQLYNRKGVLAVERMTIFEDDGYPIGIALSSTGEVMATSYLSMNQGSMDTHLTFFSFAMTGEIDSDKILGAFTLNDTLAPEIQFLDDQHLTVVGDHQIEFYSIENKPKLIKHVDIYNEIQSVCYNDKNITLQFGQATVPNMEDLNGKVITWNKEGDRKDKLQPKDSVMELIGGKNGFYIITKTGIQFYSSGKMLWESDNYKEATDIQKIDQESFLIVYASGYEIVKIKDI